MSELDSHIKKSSWQSTWPTTTLPALPTLPTWHCRAWQQFPVNQDIFQLQNSNPPSVSSLHRRADQQVA
eukprot:scaffold30894_cov14-Tisochrysis_lutea.AAC.1